MSSNERLQENRSVQIIEKKVNHDGTIEILISHDQATYQLVWENSYTGQVLNPDLDIEDFIKGNKNPEINRNKRKLLFGVNANGRCSFECIGCSFANTRMRNVYKTENQESMRLAKPVSPDLQLKLMEKAEELVLHSNMENKLNLYGCGALLSGDSATHPQLEELILTVATRTNCISSRWSSIAPASTKNVLARFATASEIIKQKNVQHTASFQISLHSTDPSERARHVGTNKLIDMDTINYQAKNIYSISQRKLTIAFVTHRNSVIEPEVIASYFNPVHTMISLRPMINTSWEMEKERFLHLYRSIREKGFDVVYIPASQSGAELDNLRMVNPQ